MTRVTIERETLLPCPFCGDDGDKGRQEVTQMIESRNKFARITCRVCGAMCPEENWNRRAALAAQPAPVAAPLTDARVVELARKHGTIYTNRHYPESPGASFSHGNLQAFARAVLAAGDKP
jgi:hypothetical protein